jgi:hypothetical protein
MFDLTKEFIQEGSDSTMTKSKGKIEPNTNVHYKRIEKLIILHGFLVSVGFLVLLPAGSLIGRWGRVFTPRWFKAHWMCNMAVAFPIITFGVLLGPAIVYSKESYRIHFANKHEVSVESLDFFLWQRQTLFDPSRSAELFSYSLITHKCFSDASFTIVACNWRSLDQ